MTARPIREMQITASLVPADHHSKRQRSAPVSSSPASLRATLDDSPMRRFQWAAVAVCVLLNMLDGFDVLVMAFTGKSVSTEFGLNGAQLVYNPSATHRGLSSHLWRLEQPAAAVANEYFVAAINRVGVEEYGDNDFYGTSYFVDPRGQFVGDTASDKEEELVVRDLDFDLVEEVRQQWAFYRDRRPDAYDGLVQP